MQDELAARRDLAQAVYRRLETALGLPDWGRPLPALDELVSTILSQNTNDCNRDVAFQALTAHYPSWEAVRDAPEAGVVAAIRPAGLANQKGPRIQAVLRQITAERGGLDLEFLRDLPVEDGLAWLTRFNGVGPKTASIVLLFSLGKAAFPVDTHVHRVSGRIGLRPDKMTAEEAHGYLARLFDPAQYGPAHMNLIRLGRLICHARGPQCPRCPVRDLCAFANP